MVQFPGCELPPNDLDAVFVLQDFVIYTGDLNTRHVHQICSSVNRSRSTLFNYLHNTNTFFNFLKSPTFYFTNCMTPTILDTALVKRNDQISDIQCIQAPYIGHISVFITLKGEAKCMSCIVVRLNCFYLGLYSQQNLELYFSNI